jgi:hypothetical protein
MPGADEFDTAAEAWRKQFWSEEDSAKTDTEKRKGNGVDGSGWSEPDMGVTLLRRRPPPRLARSTMSPRRCSRAFRR